MGEDETRVQVAEGHTQLGILAKTEKKEGSITYPLSMQPSRGQVVNYIPFLGLLAAQWGRRVAQQARYRLAGSRAKEVMLMSFKIRMKMFIAESRTCVSAESCGKGTALSQPVGVIFAHSLFICWWCCLTGPWSGLRLPGWAGMAALLPGSGYPRPG